MLEVIVRMSLDGDTGSVVRNMVARMLNACGIGNGGTGEWRGNHVHPAAAAVIGNVVDVLLNPHQVPNADIDVEPDHVWIYIKRVN